MIGQRGVPATRGGIERHVEELGARLVQRGHEVTVFCRTSYVAGGAPEYRGMQLRYLPSLDSKHLEALSHSLVCSLATLGKGFDIVHFHALGPGLFTPLPRWLSRAKVVQTVHGRDDQRAKWGMVARSVLRTAGWMSARVPDATITVSRDLQVFYQQRYQRRTDYIPSGVVPPAPHAAGAEVARLGLRPRQYLLFVGRLVPEKAPDLLIRAFRALEDDVRLVIVGGSSHSTDYVGRLEALAGEDPRVSMVGYQYGDSLAELYTNAAAFVLPSSLEGLPLTLLEGAASGLPIVASNIPPHLEVLGSDDRPGRRIFPVGQREELLSALQRVLRDPPAEHRAAEAFARDVVAIYQWDATAEKTLAVYDRLLGGNGFSTKDVAVATE
ncbi:MAG: glycosyltransferase family 4 protein [Acidimicrobiales bacterium]